jgi:hypothetical protein
VSQSSTLVYVAQGPASEGDQAAVAELLRQHAGLQFLVVRLQSAAMLEFGFAARVIDLPMGSAQASLAEAIGMQLCLNEGSHYVGTIKALATAELDVATTCLAALQDGQADVIFVAAEDPLQDAFFASMRAAFAVSFWGALADGLATERRDILASVLDLAGRRAMLFRTHQQEAGFERLACRDLTHFAANGSQLRRKLGITIDRALKPATSRVRKIAVVTPYYKEPDSELQRCLESVLQQTLACDHILVSDGFPNPLVEQSGAIHIKLGQAHGDNGNTPRYVGGLLAFALGYDAVAYLDADNWYHPRHIELLVRKQHETLSAAVCSMRTIFLPSGFRLPIIDEEDRLRRHVDTSCLMITRSIEYVAHLWGQMPQAWGPVCDRVVFSAIVDEPIAWSKKRTLNFKSNYAYHYIDAGQPVPSSVHDIPFGLWKSFATQDQAFRDLSKSRTGRTIGIHISRSHWEWLTSNRTTPRDVGTFRR